MLENVAQQIEGVAFWEWLRENTFPDFVMNQVKTIEVNGELVEIRPYIDNPDSLKGVWQSFEKELGTWAKESRYPLEKIKPFIAWSAISFVVGYVTAKAEKG